MDAFLDAYFAIDTDMKGVITSKELTRYMKENKYDDAFVKKWLRLFDSNNTGKITLEEYCHVLGLEAGEVKATQVKKVQAARGMPSDVTILSSDMQADLQLRIVEIVREGLGSITLREAAKFIKLTLDRQHSKLWHVVIVEGQYWSYYSHEPGFSFVFRIGNKIFIIFRTPFL